MLFPKTLASGATRSYRKRKADELKVKERERSHKRFVAKQRQQYGPNVKVVRRARKKSV